MHIEYIYIFIYVHTISVPLCVVYLCRPSTVPYTAVGPSLACKVMPDLEKFMETMNTKMSSAYDMVEVLEDPSNPPPMERYTVRLIQTIIFLVMHIFVYMSIYIYIYTFQTIDPKGLTISLPAKPPPQDGR